MANFRGALTEVLLDLAHQVVKDGEGATKFVTVRVTGAETPEAARRIAFSIANSPLVKTAIAGEDPNWGRVVMAVGKAGEAADRDRLSIWLGDILVAKEGEVAPSYREELGANYMKRPEIAITVDVGVGEGSSDRVDLRSHRRVHRHQCRLPVLRRCPPALHINSFSLRPACFSTVRAGS